jgi:hypothetical protein
MKVWHILGAVWLVSGELALAETKASAKPAPVGMEEQLVEGVTCTQGKETRRLEVQTKEAGCRLFYTKGGGTNEIGASRNGVDLCKNTLKGVRMNLEKAGYKCQ